MKKSAFLALPATLQRIASPLGDMYLAASQVGLCGAWFAQDQKYLPAFDDPSLFNPGKNRFTQAAAEQLKAYFAGQFCKGKRDFDFQNLPLDLSAGTAFQQSVWQALLSIPYGAHSSYGQIAQQLSKPQASRAVGAAVGRNPISILVPCHRVLGQNGSLTGYAGGLNRKLHLLQLEGLIF